MTVKKQDLVSKASSESDSVDVKTEKAPKVEVAASTDTKETVKKVSADKKQVSAKKAKSKAAKPKTNTVKAKPASSSKPKTKAKKSTQKAVAKTKPVKTLKTAKTKSKKPQQAKVKAATNTINRVQTYDLKEMEKIMTQGKTQFDKLAKDAANESQKSAEAVVKAGNILFKGAEDYMKTYVDFAQQSAEKSQEAFKAILGCKTLNEFTETQNKLAQESFDDFMSGFTKLSEISVKVATDAFEPINDQLTQSIKKATDGLAA